MPPTDLHVYYAPEVERALIGLLWHEPEHLALVLRRLVIATDIFEPAHQILFEAIDTVYRELNACDWAMVIAYLRETSQLEAVGGLLALDQIYAHYGHSCLLEHYLEFLRDAGSARQTDPTRSGSFLSGGYGCLSVAKSARTGGEPLFFGKARIAGHFYRITGRLAACSDGSNELKLVFEFQPRKENVRSDSRK